jgi:hypothetical protein
MALAGEQLDDTDDIVGFSLCRRRINRIEVWNRFSDDKEAVMALGHRVSVSDRFIHSRSFFSLISFLSSLNVTCGFFSGA